MITDFNLESNQHDNCIVFKTYGYINNFGGQKIVDEFNKHKESGINNFVINLEESKIINSIGISYLIEIIESLNNSSGKLIFTNLDPTIEKTFTIMGLLQFAEKEDTVEQALKAF